MKKLSMLMIVLLGIVTMSMATPTADVEDGVKTVKETATAVTNAVDEVSKAIETTANAVVKTAETVEKTSQSIDKSTQRVKEKITTSTKSVKPETVETNTNVVEPPTLTETDFDIEKYATILERYGSNIKETIIGIFNYAKDPAKELFELFVWKVRIYGLVDLGIMLLFITLTIVFGKWFWKAVVFMSKRAYLKKKSPFIMAVGAFINFGIAITFLILSVTYIQNSKQIIMDSAVPEYQAIKDVAIVLGTATGSEATKEVANSMTK